MSFRTKLATSVTVVGVLAVAVASLVHSSFSSAAKNDGNSFQSGSISLTDNDAEKAVFDLTGLEPATPPQKRCLTVSYGSSGDLRSSVRLFGTTGGELAEHLRLRVVRGAFSGAAPGGNACTGFTADTTDYRGEGAGVLFDGTLAAYPDSWTDGIADPRSWRAGDSAAYLLEVSIADTDDAQGKSASQQFAFEARTA
jgi:hypothetical protein